MINKFRAGFTMIELLVVVTIIILLTTVGIASYQQVSRNARNSKRKTDLETVRQALVLYRSSVGQYPGGDFPAAVGTLQSNNYLNVGAIEGGVSNIQDPKNTPPYQYSYSSTGPTFTLTARLEPDETLYELNSP